MIYTLTLNPALDYIMLVPEFHTGKVQRSLGEMMYPGGKGINVSIMLTRLGAPNKALGITAGKIGRIIEDILKELHLNTDFIYLDKGETRINVKLKGIEESEINGNAPEILPADIECLKKKLDELKANDYLVIAGSLPRNIDQNTYNEIIKLANLKQARVVLDTSGECLKSALPYKPFLIKPNHLELSELFGVENASREELVKMAVELQKEGAQNVLVSMAGDGAFLLAENGRLYEHKAPKGIVINSVGSGDSMIAGFLTGWIEKNDYQYALSLGIAAGSASAFKNWLAEREDVIKLLRE